MGELESLIIGSSESLDVYVFMGNDSIRRGYGDGRIYIHACGNSFYLRSYCVCWETRSMVCIKQCLPLQIIWFYWNLAREQLWPVIYLFAGVKTIAKMK